ncbi:MAG: hypothetical protein CSA62_04790 [Planctomycetota bacterium]|nr:MAG: hypothetical protein CSA62_04790 [Planctomycetota bacterium]
MRTRPQNRFAVSGLAGLKQLSKEEQLARRKKLYASSAYRELRKKWNALPKERGKRKPVAKRHSGLWLYLQN